ncbi:hypothetical protein DICPUDRAFT_80200 [Dictyostelium purpureum]|uniref:Uncharacterized protein n=1 Tax=Dictyostelium purpureum TaxID=5786 RepID=F0ZPT6_DICPU|nr:uncharacterized protein DICPUDRAFT_80200 [Dictyostelium purpureum]EGC34025.1 hypothetical protein DICPUDRAFT_80200 [Dictyostelium purpureum]|eukprot:XP_003289429.1 hypothetical protein DICPUDRAFT_80200 [Dictyostelium purpureum]
MENIDIQNKQVAHMVAQIRGKQLACEQSQNAMKDNIIIYFEINKDYLRLNKELTKYFRNHFKEFVIIGNRITEFLSSEPISDVGYPNQKNKTHQQLILANEWINKYSAFEIIDQIRNGIFFNGLSNSTSNIMLPELESDCENEYWGNENPSVTPLLLYAINKIMGYPCNDDQFLVGCGKRVLFLKKDYLLPDHILTDTSNYPFADKKSMILFGSYQFGGQRRFSAQYIFGPEDCSSSLSKALFLNSNQVAHFCTPQILNAFENPDNQYKFKKVIELCGNTLLESVNSVEPGDIFLTTNHTGLFLTKPNFGVAQNSAYTIEFKRNLDSEFGKCEGGGFRIINLNDGTRYYILRPNIGPLKQIVSLKKLIEIIDSNYQHYKITDTNTIGDCRILIDNII